MSQTKLAYNALKETVRQLEMVKAASNGFNSSGPSDPNGNGTKNYSTGSFFEEFTGETPDFNPPNVGSSSSPSLGLSEDNQGANSGSSFPVEGSDEWEHAEDVSKTGADDPGSSFITTEKEGSYYDAFSFEENMREFQKSAAAVRQLARNIPTAAPRNLMEWAKTAADAGVSPEEAAEAVALNQVPEEALQELASLPPEELESVISDLISEGETGGLSPEEQSEAAALEELPDGAVEQLSELPDEALEEIINAANSGCSEAGCSPEDVEKDAAICKKAFYELSASDRKWLSNAPTKDLIGVFEKCAEAIEDAQLEALIQENPEVAETLDALSQLPEEELAMLDSLPPEEAAEVINAVQEAVAEQKIAADPELSQEANAIDSLTEKEAEYLTSLDNVKLASFMHKCAEEANAIMAGEQSDIADENAAVGSMPPEVMAMLEQLSPEEQEEVLKTVEAVLSGEIPLEAVLGEGQAAGLEGQAGPASPDAEVTPQEGIEELSAAMDEQGVTPQDLATLDQKQGSYNGALTKYANAIWQYRNSGQYRYAPPTNQKRASIRQHMHGFLAEVRANANRYLQEVTR